MNNRLQQFGLLVCLLSYLLMSCATAPTILPEVQSIKGVIDRSWAISSYLSGRNLDPIEGVWVWDDSQYEVAIVRNTFAIGPEYQFVGFITDTQNANWNRGEVKLLLKETASPGIFSCTYFMGAKNREGTTLIMTNPNLIEFNLPSGPYGTRKTMLLIRVYPKTPIAQDTPNQGKSDSGSGFLVASDIVATNYHVVADAKTILVNMSGIQVKGELLLRDPQNDLALIKLSAGVDSLAKASLKASTRCLVMGNPDKVTAGDRVYSLGFPLSGLLGSGISASEGLINNTRGLQDDPRMFQISVPIQPGSSGSPLFDTSGKVIGIITSTLNNKFLFASQGVLPQNVNFAVKISYLKSMLALIPDEPCLSSEQSGGSILSPAELTKLYSASVVGIQANR